MDFLDIDKRVDHAIERVDQVAQSRIAQIDQVLTAKIEEVRELINGISFSVVADAKQIKKP